MRVFFQHKLGISKLRGPTFVEIDLVSTIQTLYTNFKFLSLELTNLDQLDFCKWKLEVSKIPRKKDFFLQMENKYSL